MKCVDLPTGYCDLSVVAQRLDARMAAVAQRHPVTALERPPIGAQDGGAPCRPQGTGNVS